ELKITGRAALVHLYRAAKDGGSKNRASVASRTLPMKYRRNGRGMALRFHQRLEFSGGAAFGSGSRRLVFQRFQCPSEVSLAALHFEAVLYGDHLDRPVFSIWIKVRWLVAQSILIAQCLFNLAKGFRQLTFITSGQNVSSG